MIPYQSIVAWGNVVPWVEMRQIEQDLIISRVLVEIFSDNMLRDELRFRGGTALNKLHFPIPSRYSEDIDLVRTSSGPIGPILDQLREILEPWLGRANFSQSPVAPKLLFQVKAEDSTNVPIRLKIEINTREIKAFDRPIALPFNVENPWFSGETAISTFTCEEMLATKLRALLQRDKGRDLFDLAHALKNINDLDFDLTIRIFELYLDQSNLTISRAQAQERMFSKLANPHFLLDVRPMLPAAQATILTNESNEEMFRHVFEMLIDRLPGKSWVRTLQMKEQFGIS